jgi:hypothetical protein
VHADDIGKVGDLARPAGMKGVSAEKMLADLRKAVEGKRRKSGPSRTRSGFLRPRRGCRHRRPETAAGGVVASSPADRVELAEHRKYHDANPRTVRVRQDADRGSP